MISTISIVMFYIGVAVSLLFIGSLFVCKRKDISWIAILAAGPFVLVRLREYFVESRRTIPPTLFALGMAMFVISWVLVWGSNNIF